MTLDKRYLRFPTALPVLSAGQSLAYRLRGLISFPAWWLMAAFAGAPAMRLRWRCLWTGVRLLLAGGGPATAYRCIVSPFDSVRHFEFDFFWRRTRSLRWEALLDVSSPRLLPLMLLDSNRSSQADIINPDGNDLQRTKDIAKALGLAGRCRFSDQPIEQFESVTVGYGLITCMSVLEHIEDDIGAIRTMWKLLAPGGHLLVSIPCAAQGFDEYSDFDEYGLLPRDGDGFVFWQRYYDLERLRELFRVVGKPVTQAVFGERRPGTYDADVSAKRSNPRYPHWRDAFDTAQAYEIYDNVEGLRGMGVIAMEFIKPPLIGIPDGGSA